MTDKPFLDIEYIRYKKKYFIKIISRIINANIIVIISKPDSKSSVMF